MMRLPPCRPVVPTSLTEAVDILASEGASARLVAGGTDLLPNMKRRQQTPTTLVAIGRLEPLQGARREDDGTWRLGASARLRTLERTAALAADHPALTHAVRSIATPLIRNTATIGGNVCLDTRCNYYDQSWEWRRAIDFCMKCEGSTCWVAPSSPRCWAVNSSDSVPVLMALGAEVRLHGPDGERTLPVGDLFRDDGIDYLAKAHEEIVVDLRIPAANGALATYRKVRRRGAFDFPVLGVAIRLAFDGDRIAESRIVLNAVGSRPVWSRDAMAILDGRVLDDEVIHEAVAAAWKPAKPLDNTDHEHTWRKKMVKVEVRRALAELREVHDRTRGAA